MLPMKKCFLRMLICSENVVLGKGLVPPPHHPQQWVEGALQTPLAGSGVETRLLNDRRLRQQGRGHGRPQEVARGGGQLTSRDFDINFSDIITVAPRVEIHIHFWKGAKFAGSVGHPMTKMLSASGGFAHDPLIRGSAPGPRWGLCPQTPVIG